MRPEGKSYGKTQNRSQAAPAPTTEPLLDGALDAPCSPWETAYLRFETPEQEVEKFMRRLTRLRVSDLPREAEAVELFCGRGNGLVALRRMGFANIEGVDSSARLLAQYRGSARVFAADCRQLPFEDLSKDLLIVQGGLHHLAVLPDDLELTLEDDGGCCGKTAARSDRLSPGQRHS